MVDCYRSNSVVSVESGFPKPMAIQVVVKAVVVAVNGWVATKAARRFRGDIKKGIGNPAIAPRLRKVA